MGDSRQVSMSIVIVSSVIRIVMAKPPGPSGPANQYQTKYQRCAARRPVIFPVEPGGIWRMFLGLMAYLDLKGEGDKSMPGNQRPRRCVRAARCGDPRDMAKAGLPEP
jgi:hypothetical protein